MNKIQKLVYITLGPEVVARLSKELSVRVTTEELLLALVKQSGKELQEIAELDLSYEFIKATYQESDSYKLLPKAVAIVELSESIIPEGTERALYEQQVKHKGEVWVIHKNDADPHPSIPHAHNYDANLKLHLGNGDLYNKRKIVGNIGKKALIALREKIVGIELPALAF
jgi:hypothetical protein